MSALNSLKLTAIKKGAAANPAIHRRTKLSKKIGEQIELAKAEAEGSTFTSKRLKTIKDDDGNTQCVEVSKKVRAWWFPTENGKVALNVRYGARVVELAKGKTAVEVATINELIPTLAVIKKAIDAGELDPQIEAASIKLREGFGK
ncbi:hypothetical protein B9Z35_05530 [Limnohabitans sp. Jir61]|uniref:DUF6641 family protein n=1 Tax=Limnohabitans sp. Jir61 TaxID=1826168 RepID=UPI000D338C40|nr:DUF6641 family protein [Limnohabitans sp. Jir61]PUE32984.1 hypothetical protein B9Z35_05530 [Limnohabitans sp. Jir61]